ncbi:TPA: hypothetical protein IOH10_002642 [Salmonella enterica]|nr:hypothetical protein [Salmonella enterica]
MKNKSSLLSGKVIVGFEHVRSNYVDSKIELLKKAYRDACILFDRGSFHDALLSFCFIRDEFGHVISSCYFPAVSDLFDMFINTDNRISDCMHKLLNSGEKCYDE